MTQDPTDRRREYRLPGKLGIFVELRAAGIEDGSPAEILACSGLDLSPGGLQLLLDRPLPVGAILRLGADFGQGAVVLNVVGEVRWCRPAAVGYQVGFALFDSEGTDIADWKKQVAARLSD